MSSLSKNSVELKTRKKEVIAKVGLQPQDTGSTASQVGILTERIRNMTDHLKTHRKDFSTQRGLMKLVGQRRRLLAYLKMSSPLGYADVLTKLSLRK